MNTNLTATPIVDKNGRATTVHKKIDGNVSPASKKLPSPAAPKATKDAVAKTPLVDPPQLTPEQRAEFNSWYKSKNYRTEDADALGIDDDIQSLAWHVTHAGRAEHYTVVSMLDDYVRYTLRYDQIPAASRLHLRKVTHPVPKLKAHLRIVERVGQEDAGVELSNDVVRNVMNGYCYSNKQEDRIPVISIDTEEDLASLTAVTLFVQKIQDSRIYNQTRYGDFVDAEGSIINGLRMINRSLDMYLRENPSEVHDIIDYVIARKPGTSAKVTKEMLKNVAEIKEHGALGKGWL